MAVFTEVTRSELDDWLAGYSIGTVSEFRGISEGIENSNYFVTATRGAYVLTLFERLSAEQLPFYLELMRHLAARGVPCPAPLSNHDGALFSMLKGKPAALVTRLPGRSVVVPTAHHCALIGAALARMHLAGRDFSIEQPNLRGLAWWQKTVPKLMPFLDTTRAAMLQDEMALQSQRLPELAHTLPRGPIHADLFRDNALFDGERLGGFIDFYFAGCDPWMFDVAVCVNDWCIVQASGALNDTLTRAFLDAYQAVRACNDAERDAWPLMLRAAALRFWVSRLHDFHLPRPAQLLTPHDPAHFERILNLRRNRDAVLPASAQAAK
jgi:homoserine kinase type II